MKTTVNLPDETAERLRSEAERRGITVTDLVREAVEDKLGMIPGGGGGHRLSITGIISSGIPDLATRFDEYLADGFPG